MGFSDYWSNRSNNFLTNSGNSVIQQNTILENNVQNLEDQITQLNEIFSLQYKQILNEKNKIILNQENYIAELNKQLHVTNNSTQFFQQEITKLKQQLKKKEIQFNQDLQKNIDQKNLEIQQAQSKQSQLIYLTWIVGVLAALAGLALCYYNSKNQDSIQQLKKKIRRNEWEIQCQERNVIYLEQKLKSEKIQQQNLQQQLEKQNQEQNYQRFQHNRQPQTYSIKNSGDCCIQ